MLVLTRKAEQKIQIGGDVVITILDVKGRYVRIGIEAPADVRILRGELNAPAPVPGHPGPTTAESAARTEPPSAAPHVITSHDVHDVSVARPHH